MWASILSRELVKHYEVVGLSRNPPGPELIENPAYQWKHCDLHNLRELEEALAGCDMAIYLIHSMLPNLRLNQGTFQDFDLSLADNFGRATKKNGINHVIYLSGLIPDKSNLSKHLQSRHEVEVILRSYVPSVTVLRAGIIAGIGGSSFTIVYKLVKRLPLMLCPAWTKQEASMIGIRDVVRSILFCMGDSETKGRVYDIGPSEAVTYLCLMQKTAEYLGLKRRFLQFPGFLWGYRDCG